MNALLRIATELRKTKNNLKKHLKSHTADIITCSHCEMKYKQKLSIKAKQNQDWENVQKKVLAEKDPLWLKKLTFEEIMAKTPTANFNH